MLMVISPAKKLDEAPLEIKLPIKPTQRLFQDKSLKLVNTVKKYSATQLSTLMGISEKLAKLNHTRYHNFEKNSKTKPAMYLFAGDTYTGLAAQDMDAQTIKQAQARLRILSGLYGVLKPLDEIAPYRLEMGTSLPVGKVKTLYQWWSGDVTSSLNSELKAHDYLLNLASQEYFKVIDTHKLVRPVVEFKFLDNKNGKYKIISFSAKKARGAMARIILEQKIKTLNQLKAVEVDHYKFNSSLSSELEMVYTRG